VIAKTPLPFSPVRISRRTKLERHGTLRGTRCRGLDAAEIMPPHRGSAKALTLRLPEPAGAVKGFESGAGGRPWTLQCANAFGRAELKACRVFKPCARVRL